jgi:hypothetical protein
MAENFHLDEIEQEIKNTLSTVFSQAELQSKGNSEWTTREFEALTRLGGKNGFKVVSSQTNEEWLFDLIWYEEETPPGEHWGINSRLKKLVLVLESEWSDSYAEIMTDFQKLLVTNARYRLMVCTAWTEDFENLIEAFQDSINRYELLLVGSTFLVCMISLNGKKMRWIKLVKQ